MTADPEWTGGWEADRDAKRQAWAAMSCADRLEWLEGALDLALASGALKRERAQRAEFAAQWQPES